MPRRKKTEAEARLSGTMQPCRHGDGKRDVSIFQDERIVLEPRKEWQAETIAHFQSFARAQSAIKILSEQDVGSILTVWDIFDDYVRSRVAVAVLRESDDPEDAVRLERAEDRSHKIAQKYLCEIKAYGVSPEGRMKLLAVTTDAERKARATKKPEDDTIIAELVQ